MNIAAPATTRIARRLSDIRAHIYCTHPAQAPGFGLLQVPHLLVYVQHQVLAPLRKIAERDLASQYPVRRAATVQGVAVAAEWVLTHAHVEVLARLLQREKSREHCCVAFGGHAAVVVESDVARNAVRQEPVQSIPQCHPSLRSQGPITLHRLP